MLNLTDGLWHQKRVRLQFSGRLSPAMTLAQPPTAPARKSFVAGDELTRMLASQPTSRMCALHQLFSAWSTYGGPKVP